MDFIDSLFIVLLVWRFSETASGANSPQYGDGSCRRWMGGTG